MKVEIDNSYNGGIIFGTSNLGGLVGTGSYADLIFTNSYNVGNINGTQFNVGGLVGFAASYSNTISFSYNRGNVSGNYKVGGLIGYSTDCLYIYYSINFGDVTASNDTTLIGGITGYLPTTNDIEQVYFSGTIIANGAEVTGVAYGTKVTDLSTFNLAFFTTTLGWSADVWDFTGLDVANGVYPTLIPVV